MLPRPEWAPAFAIGAAVLLVVAVAAPLWLARRQKRRLGDGASPTDAPAEAVLSQYKTYSVKRVLGPEALGVFSAIAVMATGQLWFLAGVAAAAILIGVTFPSRRGQAEFFERMTGRAPPAET
jgi:hypothetical protein